MGVDTLIIDKDINQKEPSRIKGNNLKNISQVGIKDVSIYVFLVSLS